jgi:hypothetical protein
MIVKAAQASNTTWLSVHTHVRQWLPCPQRLISVYNRLIMATSKDPESYIYILCNYPAIDNHAHPLLTASNRNRLPFEGLTSGAEGPALDDAVYTLPHSTARRDLARLYGLPLQASWEDIKKHRSALPYDDLCRLCFENAKIQCVLIDDGLPPRGMVEEYRWHDRYTSSPTRRIVRVETVAEVCMPRASCNPRVRTRLHRYAGHSRRVL